MFPQGYFWCSWIKKKGALNMHRIQSHCWALCHHKTAQQLFKLSTWCFRLFSPEDIPTFFDYLKMQDSPGRTSAAIFVPAHLCRTMCIALCTCDTLLAAAVIPTNCFGGPCTTRESARVCSCLRLIVFDGTWSRGLLCARPSSWQTSCLLWRKCPPEQAGVD